MTEILDGFGLEIIGADEEWKCPLPHDEKKFEPKDEDVEPDAVEAQAEIKGVYRPLLADGLFEIRQVFCRIKRKQFRIAGFIQLIEP